MTTEYRIPADRARARPEPRRTALTALAGNEVEPDWQPIPGPRREDYKNASAFCAAERAFLGDEAFALAYGGRASAFGKCVSAKR